MSFRAHINLMQLEGAGAWLYATPSNALGLIFDSASFGILLQRRLRMKIFENEFYCPFCDEVMDCWADHLEILREE